MSEFQDAGVDQIIFLQQGGRNRHDHICESLELFGSEVLPRFLVARMPPGLGGLMLAAIFAASMSSLDSAIHSMSTSVMVDLFRQVFEKDRP